MLQIIFGNQRNTLLEKLSKIMGDDSYHVYDEESFNHEEIIQWLKSDGLFDADIKKVAFYGLTTFPEGKEFFKNYAQDFKESPHTCVMIEPSFLAPLKKIADAHGITYTEFSQKNAQAQDFDMFQFGDALAQKDKKKLWILFQEALDHGKDAQDIFNILWWQIKNMMLISVSDKNPGLHPFVYDKTKRALTNFNHTQLQNMMREYMAMFHEARLGKQSLTSSLEQYIIQL